MSKRKTTEEYKKELYDIQGDTFTLLSEYKTNNTKITLRCNKCGNIIYKRPSKMIGSQQEGCYICAGKNHYRTKESFQQEINKRFPNKYLLLSDYVKARQPLKIRNLSCGHEYMISPDNLYRGKGCPICVHRQSTYMDYFESILDKYNIKYIKEYKFQDCINIRALSFDYYLLDYNYCVEVDGQFHYQKEKGYYDQENIKKRDNIKNEYCKTHNIKLIRLPQFEKDNFEKIILKELDVNTEITNAI